MGVLHDDDDDDDNGFVFICICVCVCVHVCVSAIRGGEAGHAPSSPIEQRGEEEEEEGIRWVREGNRGEVAGALYE